MTPADEATRRRRELVETAQELLRRGLVEGTSGNLSVRLPDGTVALTPASLAYETMRIDDLAMTDLDGRRLGGEHPPTTEMALHLACLRRYPEIGAVIHCHALHCTMFALTRRSIPSAVEEFELYVGGAVPIADYALSGSDELGEEVARHLADRGAVLLANHGLVTVGRDLGEALKIASLVERTARIVWGAHALGEIAPLPEASSRTFAARYMAARRGG